MGSDKVIPMAVFQHDLWKLEKKSACWKFFQLKKCQQDYNHNTFCDLLDHQKNIPNPHWVAAKIRLNNLDWI